MKINIWGNKHNSTIHGGMSVLTNKFLFPTIFEFFLLMFSFPHILCYSKLFLNPSVCITFPQFFQTFILLLSIFILLLPTFTTFYHLPATFAISEQHYTNSLPIFMLLTLLLKIAVNKIYKLITHVINTTTLFKVILLGNLSSVLIKILVSSNFPMPTILLILSNTLSKILSLTIK